MTRSYTKGLAVTLLLALLSLPVMADTDLATLTENQRIADFSTECLYQNELGKVMGARFRHVPSGFVLDLLRIQSVPQSFIWVNTHPATDQGTPHTLEHLLLGKGTKGRWVASYEDMSLGRSSAFTERLRTCYHFHTTAGGDIFFDLFEKKLDAMLHPNYTDEEIRREVCNIGVAMDPTDSTLRLEEKGTVYTEMISSFERPWGDLWYQLGKTLYGPNHPDGNSSGGLPAAIRTLTPQDIRNFHDSTHHLNNMGAQVSIADDISIDECLAKLSGIFARVEPDATPAAHPEDAILAVPEPAGAEPGTMVHVSFPHQNPDEPGLMVFAWPAKIELDPQESYLLDFMLDNIASGQTSNLYQKFIASQTRVMDIGATSVFYWRSDHRGNPIFLGLSNVKREAASDKMMDSVRTLILDEFRTLASLADGSDELKVFNERALSRVIEGRRGLRDFLSSPPRWGYRGTGSAWMEHLQLLHRKGGFRRDLALVDELNFAEEQLKQDKNIWRDLIAKWKLLEYTPYALVTLPEPEYLARIGTETEARLATELEDLTLRYGTDATQAIEKFASEYELATASIDSAAASIEMPGFINDPPMTIDDQLKYTVDKVGGGEFVASHFDNMTGATFGLALNLNVVPQSDYVYLAALPTFMTSVGAIRDGRRITYDQMQEQLRREILDLSASFDFSRRTERTELVVRGSGSDLDESRKALDWMETVLFSPDLSEANLPRIRDAIDAALGGLRNRMRGSEESWVNDPAAAYWKQDNPLLLTTSSFLTRTHAYHRLRWQLKQLPEGPALDELSSFVEGYLAYAADRRNREELSDLLGALGSHLEGGATADSTDLKASLEKYPLTDEARVLARDAVEDLRLMLGGIPDETLASDWHYLCGQIMSDLAVPPAAVLGSVNGILDRIRHQDNVRSFAITNDELLEELRPRLESMVGRFDSGVSERVTLTRRPNVVNRLRERFPDLEWPTFVGLVNPGSRTGVHINSAPCASLVDSDRDTLLNFVAGRIYGGGGAHSMFMKTWSAGLAYSNGLRASEYAGRMSYYAERCPDLSQTMQFVVNELKNAPYDPSLADYAIAQAFTTVRSGGRYENRGESMASDLADGVTPEKVRQFRQGVLELREVPNLYDELHNRMVNSYARVLPGLGGSVKNAEGALFFVIGPEAQMESYEEYLRSVEGADTKLYRLYPRDFWLVE